MIDELLFPLSRLPGEAAVVLLTVVVVAGAVVLARLGDRVSRLEREVARLRQSAVAAPADGPDAASGARPAAGPEPGSGAAPAPPTRETPAARPGGAPPVEPVASGAVRGPFGDPAGPAAAPAPVVRGPFIEPPPAAGAGASRGVVSALLGGGNWLVRGGVLLLFLGVAFLVKLAADHALLPVELRLAAIAAGGAAMIGLGRRLVARRRAYALALQGGGVGLLYLAVYAALRLHGLLAPGPAFALMVAITAGAGWLAWRQDALALAVLGALGGFAAPLLASTGSGSHVLLFAYYAVLNAGVLGLAFLRAWRALNLTGFAATFLVSALWGQRFYDPRHFATVEPFLVLFFGMYLGVAVLFALHRSVRLRDPMDATLVFGTPLVAFGLQSRLLDDAGHALALSALALAGIYAALCALLARRVGERLRVLAEAFGALALGFATIAVPLALDARWTSASWALEGAALLWVGWRQRRTLARLAGAGLQAVAGVAWLWHRAGAPGWETGDWLGTVMLAVAGLASSAVLARDPPGVPAGPRASDERALGLALGVAGLAWWGAGGAVQIVELLEPARAAWTAGALLGFLAASALALDVAGARRRWALARVAGAALAPVLAIVAMVQVFHDAHPLAGAGAAGWPAALAAALLVLFRQEARGGRLVSVGHVLVVWLLAGLGAWELAFRAGQWLPAVESWQRLPWLLAPAAVVAVVTGCAARRRPWPFTARAALLLTAGAGPLVCIVGGGVLALAIGDPDRPWPLPYLPLLNPLDAGLAAAVAACLAWAARCRALLEPGVRSALVVAGSALGFLWLNGALLRTLHFWADVPYRLGPMFHSTLVQASVSVLWALTGLAAMVAGSRFASRTLWGVGAALMVVVVAKLMLVDLASSGTVARIVSFISVGLLLMAVGWLSPVPPRRAGGEGSQAA